MTISQILNSSEEMEDEDLFQNSGKPQVGYMNNMADDMAGSGQWSTEQNKGKRKRINTGSVNFESYETMTLGEKLNVLFNKMFNIERQELSFLKITDFQGEIQNVNSQIDIHKTYLRALSYKVIDLQTN
jgi:hypothetical protein